MEGLSNEELNELLANQRTIMEQNKQLIEENKKLREDGSSPSRRILKEVTDRTVKVAMVDNKMVVGYANKGVESKPQYVYEKPDPKDPKNMLLYVDLILDGEKDPVSVNYNEFIDQAERVKCKVIKVEDKQWKIQQGWTKKKEIDGYSTVELDFDVPIDVIGVTRFFTVELPVDRGGKQITLHESYINL
jgi:hypothetical protein